MNVRQIVIAHLPECECATCAIKKAQLVSRKNDPCPYCGGNHPLEWCGKHGYEAFLKWRQSGSNGEAPKFTPNAPEETHL